MTPLRTSQVVEATAHGVVLDCGSGIVCRIGLLAADLGRVTFLRGAPRQPTTWMVPGPGEPDTPWAGRDRLDDAAWPAHAIRRDGLTLHAAHISVRIHLDPLRLEWLGPDGHVFLADRPAMPYMFAHRTDRIEHHVVRHPTERYYGLGDKTGPLNLHGRRLRTRMSDALGYDPRTGDPLYKHWPFLIVDGPVAYGMLYDNMAEAAFDLGATHDNYHGLFRSYAAEGGDLDYYVFPGPGVADVTRRFLQLTGGAALPPRWTLGYAQTAMAIADAPDAQAQIEAFIDRCAAEDVMVSAFHFGSGYTSIGPKRYVFNWNRAKFPDPDGLMRRFHAAGMRVVANLKPCLLDDHPGYAEATPAFVQDGHGRPLLSQFWDGEGAHIDFTSPAGIAWWQAGLERAVLDVGIDVGWNDNNEYELWDEGAACAAGPLELVRPAQSLLMTRATLEAQQRRTPDERAFTVTRAGMPGIQRYAQTWSGDNTTSWESLRWNIRTGLQMSLSGMVNVGHDIGGFAGPVPEPELLIRWTQSCVLNPRFIMNSWKPDGVYNSPWLHPAALPHVRAAIRLRYRFIPYLYSLLHQAAARHDPMLLPTFAVFPNDPRCREDCDAFMAGPSLLVAPVTRPGVRSVCVYAPDGPAAWFNLDTGEMLAAGADHELAASLDRLPMLAAAGAILPMTDQDGGHDEPSRRLLIFPGPGAGESRFTLVEDDGITPGGPALHLCLALSWTPDEVRLHVSATGDYRLQTDLLRVVAPAGERRPMVLAAGPGAPALSR